MTFAVNLMSGLCLENLLVDDLFADCILSRLVLHSPSENFDSRVFYGEVQHLV